MGALDGTVAEKDLQDQVLELARLRGWTNYHTYDSRRSTAGFPDLTMVRDERLVFAELKTEKGRVSTAQAIWLGMLRQVRTVEAHLWRPSNWADIDGLLR